MTKDQALRLYSQMTPIQATGVRIRHAHKSRSGVDYEQAVIEAVREELAGKELP